MHLAANMQAMAAAIAHADAIAQQLLDEEEAAAAQAAARSAAKQGKKGKKRCAKKGSQQRQSANNQQLLQALVRPSAAFSTPEAQHMPSPAANSELLKLRL